MFCPYCKIENKCARCSKPIKEVGRTDPKTKKAWCLNCLKIMVVEEKEVIEPKPVKRINKTGGGGNNMKDADEFFDKTMQKLDHLGSGDKRLQEVNSDGRNEKIRHLQKQAQKAIKVKQKDNERQGKTFTGV